LGASNNSQNTSSNQGTGWKSEVMIIKLKTLILAVCLCSVTATVSANSLSEEEYKRGYAAYDTLMGEIRLLEFVVDQCEQSQEPIGATLVGQFDAWKRTNNDLFFMLQSYRRAMMDLLESYPGHKAKIDRILNREQKRMDDRLVDARASFDRQDLETTAEVCINVSNSLYAGAVRIQDIRPEHYQYLMSLKF